MSETIIHGLNPVIPYDMPDPDVIRVEGTYYMASTTMHNMPGCTLLRSYDLIHWEIAGYAYDTLPYTPARALADGQAYGKGMWAPTLRYHHGVFHLCFSANDTHCTYHYQASQIEGPWSMQVMEGFYYDCSLFFDDDDRVYMVHGNRKVYITELKSDLSGPLSGGLHRLLLDYDQDYPGSKMLGYEGSHLYRVAGRYHLFCIHSAPDRWFRTQSAFHADSLTEPFTGGPILQDDMGWMDQGVAQGGIVDTPDGRWFAMLFQDRGAAGRMPVLIPMHFEHGLPLIEKPGAVVENASTRPSYAYSPISSSDDFTTAQLEPQWQWNHMPRPEYIATGAGTLCITSDTLTDTLTLTHNILTQRACYPVCTAEVTIAAHQLNIGDFAGMAAFQRDWAAIGLERKENGLFITVRTHEAQDNPQGKTIVTMPWLQEQARLRIVMDFTDMRDLASLYVYQAGEWTCLHKDHKMSFSLEHFTGYKAALFMQSTAITGGTAAFRDFVLH